MKQDRLSVRPKILLTLLLFNFLFFCEKPQAMSDINSKPWLSLKTVLRVADYEASKLFYGGILELPLLEEWEESSGKGCVFGCGREGRGGFIEIYEMTREDPRLNESFGMPFPGDKIDLQLGTDSLDTWVKKLSGKWQFAGPETMPWGQRWIKLRDPDNLQIAIYEGMDPARLSQQDEA
jgi:catechol 2,3-dioxygenase-like lactoylglutathione lyase family enzyme